MLFLLTLLPALANAAEWQITGVEPRPERPTTHGNMVWDVHLALNDGQRMLTSSTTFDLVPLLDYFKVARPRDLVGVRWSSERDNPFDALDWIRVVSLHNGRYTPPDGDELLQAAAQSLSELRLPDFAQYDCRTVQIAFDAVFASQGSAAAWAQQLMALVEQRSKGRVHLAFADEAQLASTVAGHGLHLLLIQGERKLPFAVTTGRMPFVELKLRG